MAEGSETQTEKAELTGLVKQLLEAMLVLLRSEPAKLRLLADINANLGASLKAQTAIIYSLSLVLKGQAAECKVMTMDRVSDHRFRGEHCKAVYDHISQVETMVDMNQKLVKNLLEAAK